MRRRLVSSANSKDGVPFRVVETFSGIGAQRMALKTSGEPERPGGPRRAPIPYDVVATSDISRRANEAYDAVFADDGWDPRRNVGDVTAPGLRLPESDILTYSFPCQALSKSGRLGGMARGTGTTSSAVWSLLEQIEATRPEWLVMENVPNIHSKRFMSDFQSWIDALSDLGYDSRWADTNLTRFGLPQNRSRTILLSRLGGPVPEVPLGSEGHPPLSSILEDDVDLSVYGVGDAVMRKLVYGGDPHGHRDFLRVVNDTRLGYADAREGDGVTLQHLTGAHRARGRVQRGRSATLMTSGSSVGVVVRDADGFLTVRRFTPREAYRLQGFPDWAIDRILALGQGEAAMYAQAGNSLGVPMMREVFRAIDRADIEKKESGRRSLPRVSSTCHATSPLTARTHLPLGRNLFPSPITRHVFFFVQPSSFATSDPLL